MLGHRFFFCVIERKTHRVHIWLRKPNLRYFARDNGVEHYVYDAAWLINFEQFMKKLNPKNMTEHYSLPRMRQRNASVRLWNREHPRCQIDKNVVEACVTDERVCFYKRDRTWVINYDQLEVVIAEYMQTHAYIPAEIRSKRAKERSAGITAAERKKRSGIAKWCYRFVFIGLP